MAYIKKRERAVTLRKEGESINRIALKLGMKKSTVSMWCRDIVLSHDQIQALEKRQRERGLFGSLKAAERKRHVRIEATKNEERRGAQDIGKLSKRDVFILGVGLYWGEGYKRGNNEFGFTNSDPNIIRMFLLWMRAAYKIPTSDLILRVSINAQFRHRDDEAKRFWSRITKVSLSQFTKTSFINTRLQKQYPENRLYYGTLRVKVRRATALHRRILGSLAYLSSQATAK